MTPLTDHDSCPKCGHPMRFHMSNGGCDAVVAVKTRCGCGVEWIPDSMKPKPGKYRHFKGGEVEVLDIATHSETLEQFVVYRTLYDNRTYGKGSVWIRPLEMFIEHLEYEGKTVPRFEWVEEKQLATKDTGRVVITEYGLSVEWADERKTRIVAEKSRIVAEITRLQKRLQQLEES